MADTNHPSHSTGQITKKIIVNFLLRKKLTIDFMKNVQKNYGLYYGETKAQGYEVFVQTSVVKIHHPITLIPAKTITDPATNSMSLTLKGSSPA